MAVEEEDGEAGSVSQLEIKIGRNGLQDASVKINGKEVYVSRIAVELEGGAHPRVELAFGRDVDFEMACDAALLLVGPHGEQKEGL